MKKRKYKNIMVIIYNNFLMIYKKKKFIFTMKQYMAKNHYVNVVVKLMKKVLHVFIVNVQ